jgi:hypothetical protein
MSTSGARWLLATGVIAGALLCSEGALSLLAGRSLRELVGAWPGGRGYDPPPAGPVNGGAARAAPTDAPRVSDSAGDLYTAHDDPLVGYVMWPDSDLRIYEGSIRTDALGLRSRPGGPPPDDALRVVILGDSVAFGLGVDDDEAIAHRVEQALAAARGPDAPPVACRTVAMPSWNHRSAAAFLLDHWDALRPDIVLYMPCRNDVFDIDGTYPSGKRRVMPDPSAADPWLSISVRSNLEGPTLRLSQGAGATLAFEDLGAQATDADLSPESSRRLDENADTIVRLNGTLARRGCRLLLVWTTTDAYTWLLGERIARRAPKMPVTALLKYGRKEFTLGYDPHYNPQSLDVLGRWLAEDLLARGWITRGAQHALPPAPPAYAALRMRMPPVGEWPRMAAAAREHWRARMLPEVDWRSGRGLLQVYGGCNLDGSARSRVLLLLAPGGDMLEVELAPIDARPDLYPLLVGI